MSIVVVRRGTAPTLRLSRVFDACGDFYSIPAAGGRDYARTEAAESVVFTGVSDWHLTSESSSASFS
jgi:hypothetical protein